MTIRSPRAAGMPRFRRRQRALVLAVVVVIIVIALFGTFVSLFTDLLWYRSVGFSRVFTTRLGTETLLFVVFGAAMAVIIGVNIVVAYRLRPAFPPMSPEQQGLDRYRMAIAPYRWAVLTVLLVIIGLLEGSSAAGSWRTWLQWRNAVPFGTADFQFHRDVSYFAFTYPMQRLVLGTLFVAIVLSLIGAAITHFLYGGLRIQTPGEKATPATRAHLSVLLGIFVLLKAAAYWLDRFGLAFSPRGVVTGPSYTDVNAVLPAKTILAIIAIICALLFFANVVKRNWLLPAVAFALMVLSGIVIGGIYPAVVQQFQVKPNEAQREAKYIERNIKATRQAYGIDKVSYQNYSGTPSATDAQVAADKGTVPNIRLLDPNELRATFEQLQQIRAYYGFPSSLDIDRYAVTGKEQDYIVAVRELDQSGLQPDQRNWINMHLVYTHGYGFVAAPANRVDNDGRPVFAERDVPPTGVLRIDQPRVYFGELAPSYSVVGTTQHELDRDAETGQVNTVYSGRDGVGIGSFFRRVLYSVKFREKNLLLSSAITKKSRILYVRNPRERVQKVAPFLQMDGDPYPAVVDGRIVWILDGYTTSDGYPYSERRTLGAAASDSSTRLANRQPLPQQQVNYIRNSVKATVDAYDGTVTLYTWDDKDPVLKVWKRAFPGIVKPKSDIPKDLMAHFRYPEDLFKVQRDLLSSYHVSDPIAFYSKQDFWGVPADPNAPEKGDQPPYYLVMQAPGQAAPRFDLTSPLVFRGKQNLAAWLWVSSDPGDYGTIHVLSLPRNTQVNGPGQAANAFQAYAPFSRDRTLLSSGGSSLIEANLLTLPIGGGLLYVQPVYVQSSNQSAAYPVLQKVLVLYGNRIGYADTLGGALTQALGAGAAPTTTQPTTPTGTVSAALQQAIADAQKAFADGQAALAKSPPDFSAYGDAQKRLADALARIAQLTKASPSPSPSPSP